MRTLSKFAVDTLRRWCSRLRPGIAPRLRKLRFLHGTFSGDRREVRCGPHLRSGRRPVRCRGSSGAFARGLLILSEKQTGVTVNAFLAVQEQAQLAPGEGGANESTGDPPPDDAAGAETPP